MYFIFCYSFVIVFDVLCITFLMLLLKNLSRPVVFRNMFNLSRAVVSSQFTSEYTLLVRVTMNATEKNC